MRAAAPARALRHAIQYPGHTLLITGANFQADSPRAFWQSADPAISDPAAAYFASDASWLSATQLKVTAPEWLVAFPGEYLIAVTGKGQGLSNWVPVTIRPYSYRVEFTQIECVDESDPEGWGDDEIVTQWVIASGTDAWAKNTGEYAGFSDGTKKDYTVADRVVFPPAGGVSPVSDYLLIVTKLWEWDEGDVEATVKFLQDASKAIGGILSAYYGAAASAAGEIVAKVLGSLEKVFVWLFGDPDALGEKTLRWSCLDLASRTNNVNRGFKGTLEFLNDDDTGSYRLHYRVARVE